MAGVGLEAGEADRRRQVARVAVEHLLEGAAGAVVAAELHRDPAGEQPGPLAELVVVRGAVELPERRVGVLPSSCRQRGGPRCPTSMGPSSESSAASADRRRRDRERRCRRAAARDTALPPLAALRREAEERERRRRRAPGTPRASPPRLWTNQYAHAACRPRPRPGPKLARRRRRLPAATNAAPSARAAGRADHPGLDERAELDAVRGRRALADTAALDVVLGEVAHADALRPVLLPDVERDAVVVVAGAAEAGAQVAPAAFGSGAPTCLNSSHVVVDAIDRVAGDGERRRRCRRSPRSAPWRSPTTRVPARPPPPTAAAGPPARPRAPRRSRRRSRRSAPARRRRRAGVWPLGWSPTRLAMCSVCGVVAAIAIAGGTSVRNVARAAERRRTARRARPRPRRPSRGSRSAARSPRARRRPPRTRRAATA